MKIKQLICAAVGIVVALTSCAQKKGAETTASTTTPEGKTLVAYFSATGTTRTAAKQLAEVTGADLFEITPEQPYTAADLDWTDSTSRSSVEMHDLNSRPAIAAKVENMADYDTVFLGFPIWWYVAPTIINTFVESNNLEGKTVVCFATSGGSPIDPCVDALRKQYPTINWTDGRLLNGATRADLQSWLTTLPL
ncbi:MAG: NAD(P)H-dependent oxidoreductase [Paramuribaculum sp.]|nr:NAD(P)H-dependent oxidoreductase [Paramuribaculum sp.]